MWLYFINSILYYINMSVLRTTSNLFTGITQEKDSQSTCLIIYGINVHYYSTNIEHHYNNALALH